MIAEIFVFLVPEYFNSQNFFSDFKDLVTMGFFEVTPFYDRRFAKFITEFTP